MFGMVAATATDYVTVNRIISGAIGPGNICIEVHGDVLPLPDVGTCWAYTPNSTFTTTEQLQEYSSNWTAGAHMLIQGVVGNSSGGVTSPPAECQLGETMTQNTSGATGIVINQLPGEITDTPPAQAMELNVSGGSVDSTHYWLGGTSGCYFWPSTQITGTQSGTFFTIGETATEATTGATAVILQNPGVSGAAQTIRVLVTSGTPNNINTWTGGTSGATMTSPSLPASIAPGTFSTLKIYDSSCNLVATMKKLASGTPNLPSYMIVGRLGDAGTTAFTWYADNITLNYATGAMPQCY